MSIELSEIFDDALTAAKSRDHFDIHRAAIEWSLADPIIINGPEDIQSRPTWEGRVEPYQHQVRNLMTFCRRLPVTLLADDVGLGKTVSAGLILSELLSRKRVSRALVICPKILLPQWEEELRTKFDIEARGVTGKELKQEFDRPTPVVITTYNSAQKQIEHAPEHGFNMLILDEAHKLRNLYGGSGTPPKTATTIRTVLEAQAFRYVLMLTATPLHNRLWDLYSLVDCMTAGRGKNPFGTPNEFSARFIADASKGARKIKPGREEEFRRILSQYIARTRRGDANLSFPERKVILSSVQPTNGELKLMGVLGKQIGRLNGLAQVSLAQALFSSPQAFLSQVANMTAKGTLSADFEREVKSVAAEIKGTAKLVGLMSIIDQLRSQKPIDWRIVVFTVRMETQEAIGSELSKLGLSHGFIRGSDQRGNQATINKFRADPPGVHVVISTDHGAEGLNLQIANVLVNFDLPWNPMIVEQRIGRIQRLGGKYETVNVFNLLAKGTVEERVVGRLMEKLQVAAHAIGDIEAILESVGGDDCEEALENRIAEMVVSSLKGMDVEEAMRLARESIEKAREEIEVQRKEIDEKLGKNLDSIHDAGPRMPKLSRATPRIPLTDFVLRSLKAEEYFVEPERNKLIRLVPKRGPQEWITFDDSVLDEIRPGQFGGNIPKLFKQGSPAFERLAQSWCEKEFHFVIDARNPSKERLLELASVWASKINGLAVRDVEVVFKTEAFNGNALCKIRSVVAMDSYEKLVDVSLKSDAELDETHIPADSENSTIKLKLSELSVDTKKSIVRTAKNDKDISLFNTFYEERRDEELKSVGDDSRLRKKCHDDFTPKCFASVAGFTGVAFCVMKIKISYSVHGEGKYDEVIEAIPLSRQILSKTTTGICGATSNVVPLTACA